MKKLILKITIITILISSGFAYCIANDNDTVKALSFIKKINYNSSLIKTLELEGDIEYENSQNSNSGSLYAVILKPDSCYAKIRGTFGITGVIMLITRKQFTYYNVIDNFVIKGTPTEKNLGTILRVYISFDNLMDIISASFLLPDSLSKDTKFLFTNSGLMISIKDSSNIRKEYWIDTTTATLQKIKTYDDSSRVDYEISFSDYKNIKGIKFPFSIDFKRELKKEYLWLKYTDVKFKVDKVDFKINIPKSAKIYNWN